GSAQAIAASGGVLAIANWADLLLVDSARLQPVGRERLTAFPTLPEVFGVAASGDLFYVAEWNGLHVVQYHPGLAAPDIWIEADIVEFDGDTLDARALLVRNRGQTELQISSITATDAAYFSVDRDRLTLPPGGADVVEVTYTPPPGANGLSAPGRL